MGVGKSAFSIAVPYLDPGNPEAAKAAVLKFGNDYKETVGRLRRSSLDIELRKHDTDRSEYVLKSHQIRREERAAARSLRELRRRARLISESEHREKNGSLPHEIGMNTVLFIKNNWKILLLFGFGVGFGGSDATQAAEYVEKDAIPTTDTETAAAFIAIIGVYLLMGGTFKTLTAKAKRRIAVNREINAQAGIPSLWDALDKKADKA